MKKFKHLSLDERDTIGLLRVQGHSLRKIAFYLGGSVGTLSRELKRNRAPNNAYRGTRAHRNARFRLLYGHRKKSPLEKNAELREHVVQALTKRWSPELIAGRLKREAKGRSSVSHEGIYRWIYAHAPQLIPYLLRSHPRRWRRRSRSCTQRLPQRVSIHQRPSDINRRQNPGHWETDLLWSQGRAALQVLVERKTRFTRIQRLPNKKAQSSFDALTHLLSLVPDPLRKSITYDNGLENLLHAHINRVLKMNSYFCDPFQAWQKGTVENTNGLIRRFLPKQTDFDTIPLPNLQFIEDWLNNRPRKCLKFQTPAEAFQAAVALAT